MKQVMVNNYVQKPDQLSILVGSDAKNALPTSSITAMDLMGLSWIFMEESSKC